MECSSVVHPLDNYLNFYGRLTTAAHHLSGFAHIN